MNNLSLLSRAIILCGVYTLVFTSALAQDTSSTSIQHGTPSVETKVRNAKVVYVEGNDLVLKLEDGTTEHLVVPDSDVFNIDGKDVTIRDLRPGSVLTQTITTTTTPRYVNTIRVIKGKVWHASPPTSVIVRMDDGNNQLFKIPRDAKFTVNGQTKTAFELRKGMVFEATIVTDDTHMLVEENKTMVGQAPKPPSPRLVGVLLIQGPAPSAEPQPSAAPPPAADQASAALPSTGSPLPLIGLSGLILLAIYMGLRAVRRKNNTL